MLQFKEGKNVTLSRGYGGIKDFELRGISDGKSCLIIYYFWN